MTHPTHYKETLETLHGASIQLTGAVFMEPWDKNPQVDTWGRIKNEGNPIYPPRNPDRSVKKHGGVEGYKKSPIRELFHHISIAQYIGFKLRAINHFQTQ